MEDKQNGTMSGENPPHRAYTNKQVVLAVFTLKVKNKPPLQSYLLHFGYHVIIDDVHVGVCHSHQHFNHHLSLWSREACLTKVCIHKESQERFFFLGRIGVIL